MFENPDINGFVENTDSIESAQWEEIKKMDMNGHPQERDFLANSAKATGMLDRMVAMAKMPIISSPVLSKLEKGVMGLRNEAIDIRTRMTNDKISQSWNIQPGQTVNDVMNSEVDAVLSTLGPLEKALRPNFKQVLKTLSMDPFRDQGTILAEIQESRTFLDTVQKTANESPATLQLGILAKRLSSALDHKTVANPIIARGVAHKNWYDEIFAEKRIDMQPLLSMGGLLGALVATLGIGQAVFSENHDISPATVGWGFFAHFCIDPDFYMKDSGNRALEYFASLDNDGIDDLAGKGFTGPEGKKAFEELQRYQKNTKSTKILEQLQQPNPTVQLADLTGGKQTPLYKILSAMSAVDEMKALKIFGKEMTKYEQEFICWRLES